MESGVITWFISNPLAAGIATFGLMWTDWCLTVLQHRERLAAGHYQTYPVDTSEGNPLLQGTVARGRLAEPRHLLVSLCLSVAVGGALVWVPEPVGPLLLGYVWGLFLLVDCLHLGNLIGYLAGRRGLHGQIRIHQRTAYLVQMGRYLGLAVLLAVLAVCSGSSFMAGVAIAGLTSTLRQLLWMRRVPAVPEEDVTPGSGLAGDVGG